MDIPSFLRVEGDTAYFNLDGELVFFIPEEFFGNTKNQITKVEGSYVSTIGVFDYGILKPGAKVESNMTGKTKPFRFPTVFLCKPSLIEKGKGIKLVKESEDKEYRILHFKKGDEVISQLHVPQIIDNVQYFFQLMVITGKIPTSISYDVGHEYFPENMLLNGSGYGLHSQLFGILWSELCRDPKDISRPFCMTEMRDMNGYKPVSIKATPNYVSPYVAITSENFDESLRSAILMKDKEEIPYSPLEKVITN